MSGRTEAFLSALDDRAKKGFFLSRSSKIYREKSFVTGILQGIPAGSFEARLSEKMNFPERFFHRLNTHST